LKKVIIVGGGIVGATTAYELVKRNYEVTIIDNAEKGRATSAAAGIICPWISQRRNQKWYELANKGAAFLKQLVLDLEKHGKTDTGYKQVGTIRVHPDPTRLENPYKIAMKRRETNEQIGEVTLLSKEEAQEKFPLLADHYYALYVSGGARVDGRALRKSLTEAAVELGATYLNGKATLLIEGKEIVGVNVTKSNNENETSEAEITEEKLYADTVILTNGVWMPETLAPLDVPLRIDQQKGEIVHLQTDLYQSNDLPVVMAPYDHYMLQFPKGRMVVGATRENHPATLEHTAGGLHTVLTRALAVAPTLADSSIVETRVGMRPFTKDNLPVFGKVPHYDRLYMANGLGSSGLSTGPIIGQQLAKMINDEPADLDQASYRVDQALK